MAQSHEHTHEGFDIEVEHVAPCVAKISLRVSPEEFQKNRRVALQAVAKRTRMKGFRPGKAPMAVLEREYGEAVNRDVVQHLLNHGFDHAVRDHELRPALQPRVDIDAIEASPEAGLTHEFEVYLRPTIELKDVKGLRVEGQPTTVEDEEVDQTIESLRGQQARTEPAGDDGLPEDGMAVARIAYTVEGADAPALEREGVRISPQSAPPGLEPEAFAKEMTGAKEGETKSFELTIPEDFPEEDARGKQGSCVLEIKEAFQMVPATDENLAELLQVESMDEVRAKVRERMEEGKASQEQARIENELLETLLNDHPMELPEALVDQQTEARLAEQRQGLEGQGLEGEELDQRVDAMRDEIRSSSEKALRAIYLIEEIAKTHELRVEAPDFQGEFESIAERNGVPLDEVRKYYQEEGLFQQLGMELLERKVRSFLRESADIA